MSDAARSADQVIDEWVPFHKRLAKGSKRHLKRGVRFVYMELSLEARGTGGVLKFPPSWTTEVAVHDLIGGDKGEIRTALLEFAKPDEDGIAPIEIVRTEAVHKLIITKWDDWAGSRASGTSTARVRRHRANKKNAALEEERNVTPTKGNVLQNSTGQNSTKQIPPTPQGGEGERIEHESPEAHAAELVDAAEERAASQHQREAPGAIAERLYSELFLRRHRRKYTPTKGPLFGAHSDEGSFVRLGRLAIDEAGEDAAATWLRVRLIAYFADNDPWLVENAHPVRSFEKRLNKYSPKNPVKPLAPTKPQEPEPAKFDAREHAENVERAAAQFHANVGRIGRPGAR